MQFWLLLIDAECGSRDVLWTPLANIDRTCKAGLSKSKKFEKVKERKKWCPSWNRGVRLEDGPGYTWVTPYFVPEITCFNWDRFVKGVGLCERGMWCKTGRWTSLYLGRTILCTRNHLFGGGYRPTPKGRKHWAGCQKTIERYSKMWDGMCELTALLQRIVRNWIMQEFLG